METRVSTQAVMEQSGCEPAGTVHIVDPHPLNWLYITGHAATLELAETEVSEDHWSRRTEA
jgi:hypothetical protein